MHFGQSCSAKRKANILSVLLQSVAQDIQHAMQKEKVHKREAEEHGVSRENKERSCKEEKKSEFNRQRTGSLSTRRAVFPHSSFHPTHRQSRSHPAWGNPPLRGLGGSVLPTPAGISPRDGGRIAAPTPSEVMPERASYLQAFLLQASSCPVTPSSLCLLASLYSPNWMRKWRCEGGSQAQRDVCGRTGSPWLRLQPWQLPSGPILPFPLLPRGGRRGSERRGGRPGGEREGGPGDGEAQRGRAARRSPRPGRKEHGKARSSEGQRSAGQREAELREERRERARPPPEHPGDYLSQAPARWGSAALRSWRRESGVRTLPAPLPVLGNPHFQPMW